MIQAIINGTVYALLRDFKISEQSANKTSTTISVEVGEDQPFPVAGDIVEIKDGAETLFFGSCGIPKTPRYSTGNERRIVQIVCGNANDILANRVANVAYQDKTITEIVTALYTDYIAAENISLGTISDIEVEMKVYTAKDYNLQDALNELADLVGAVWEVDTEKRFNFVIREDFPRFPHTITTDFLLGTNLQHTTKAYKTRTVQYISGATDRTVPQTEQYVYDAKTNAFATVFPIATKPALQINGVAVDPSQIGVNGLNDQTAVAFLFSYNSPTLTYNAASGLMSANDILTIVYTGIYPIRISVANDIKISQIAAATGTSGRRERVQIANNINSQDDALYLAQSLLDQFSEASGEVSFWLTSRQLEELGLSLANVAPLTQFTFDLPTFGITGDFVITERTLSPIYINSDGSIVNFKIDLKLRDRDYLNSYGETISDLRHNVSMLSIRPDETVINVQAQTERIVLSEFMFATEPYQFFPTDGTSGYALFAPMDLATVYPDI